MTIVGCLQGSERFARSLLKAWDSGDVPRLRSELTQIAVTDFSSQSALEQERFEIVQEVAKIIRAWLGGARSEHPDLNIALALLRHVAAPKDTAA